jgi:hypothetical protein
MGRGMVERQREKRFRVTGRDNNGDVFAFESDNRDRAAKKLKQMQKRPELHDVQMESLPWL